MSIVEAVLLAVKLGIQIRILLLSVDEEILLVIDFLSQRLDHVDIDFNSASVVLLHSSLVIGNPIEVLFE